MLPEAPGCYLFHAGAGIVWGVIASNLLIFLSYMAISVTLGVAVLKRRRENGKGVPLTITAAWFCAFVFGCGLTHLMDIVTVWYPFFGVDLVLRAATVTASIVTAFRIVPLAGRLLSVLFADPLADAKAAEEILRARLARTREMLAMEALDPKGLVAAESVAKSLITAAAAKASLVIIEAARVAARKVVESATNEADHLKRNA